MAALLDVTRLQPGAWRWIAFGRIILTLSLTITIATLGETSFTSGGISIIPVFAAIIGWLVLRRTAP